MQHPLYMGSRSLAPEPEVVTRRAHEDPKKNLRQAQARLWF